MRSRFYFDEDSAEKALVEALRVRGVDVCVPAEVGLLEANDLEELQWCIGGWKGSDGKSTRMCQHLARTVPSHLWVTVSPTYGSLAYRRTGSPDRDASVNEVGKD